ncbi:membrane-spanning 4-domains subfamily A member 8-like [Pholidichthys leucotaenia]
MSTFTSAIPTAGSGMHVVTYVVPAPQAAAPQTGPGRNQFSHRRPEAIGTVQIMIGIVVFIFGMVWIPCPGVGAFSGIFVWGAAFFITSGSLTVAAGKSSNRCLVNTALGFNVWAAVTGGIGTIIYRLDSTIDPFYPECGSHYFHNYNGSRVGVASVLAIFCFLELIISIYGAAVFCCITPCCCGDEPAPVIIFNQPDPPASVTTTYNFPTNSEGAQPPYNPNIIV